MASGWGGGKEPCPEARFLNGKKLWWNPYKMYSKVKQSFCNHSSNTTIIPLKNAGLWHCHHFLVSLHPTDFLHSQDFFFRDSVSWKYLMGDHVLLYVGFLGESPATDHTLERFLSCIIVRKCIIENRSFRKLVFTL